jgi:hypothetical protein
MNTEGDIDTLINLVFNENIPNNKSISIINSFNSVQELFEALLMIFTKGMKKLFGKNNTFVNLSLISNEDWIRFTQHFNSLGIQPHFKKYHLYQVLNHQKKTNLHFVFNDYQQYKNDITIDKNIQDKYLKKYNTIDSQYLEDYYFQLQIDNFIYIIYFTLQ